MQEIFTRFYLSKYNGRKLHWQYTLDHCLLKGWLKEKVNLFFSCQHQRISLFQTAKEFHVSLYQALVLLLFNSNHDLTTKDIQELTKIRSFFFSNRNLRSNSFFSSLEQIELQRTLLSLACGKIRLLNKKPMVEHFHTFQFTKKLFFSEQRHQSR